MNICPVCKEQIQDKAQICKHCKSRILNKNWKYDLEPNWKRLEDIETLFKKTAESYFVNLIKLEITISAGILAALKLFERKVDMCNGGLLNSSILLFFIAIGLGYISIIFLCLDYKEDGDAIDRILKDVMRYKKESNFKEIDNLIDETETTREWTQWQNIPIYCGALAIGIFLVAIFLLTLSIDKSFLRNWDLINAANFPTFLILFSVYYFPLILLFLIFRLCGMKRPRINIRNVATISFPGIVWIILSLFMPQVNLAHGIILGVFTSLIILVNYRRDVRFFTLLLYVLLMIVLNIKLTLCKYLVF